MILISFLIPCNYMDTTAYDCCKKKTNFCISFQFIIFIHLKPHDANNYVVIRFLISGNYMDTAGYDFFDKLLMAVYH